MNENMIKDVLPLMADAKAVSTAATTSKPLFRGVLYEDIYDDFGNLSLKPVSDNTVVLGGAIAALEHLADVDAAFRPGTLNELLDLNAGVEDTSGKRPTIVLFGLGIGGAGLDFGSTLAKDIKNKDIPGLVPMRVGEDITGAHADKYFMKKLNSDGLTYSWYLKEFDTAISISTHWKDAADDDSDGTEIVADVDGSENENEIESFAEIKIALNVNDVREYFESIGEIDSARYNTLGIYTGNKVQLADGSFDYVNVRLFAYTNFNNKDLTQKTESAYTYRIYSLV